MKNWFLPLVSAVLLSACTNQENTTVAANSEKPQTTITPQQTEQILPYCTINGHDCWEVVQLLEETETISPTEEEMKKYIEGHFPLVEAKMNGVVIKDAQTGKPLLTRDLGLTDKYEIEKKLTRYDNPKLQKIGLTVIDMGLYLDGGSQIYKFSNGISIFIDRSLTVTNLQTNHHTTITWPNLEQFVFDENGNLIEHTGTKTDGTQEKFPLKETL